MSGYYQAVAQLIPLLFVIVAFELSRAYDVTIPQRRELPERSVLRSQTMGAIFAICLTWSATLGEATALQSLRSGHSLGSRHDALITVSLVSMTSAIALWTLTVWAVKTAGRRLAILTESGQHLHARELIRDASRAIGTDDADAKSDALALLDQASTLLAMQQGRLRRFPWIKLARGFLWPLYLAHMLTPAYWLAFVVL